MSDYSDGSAKDQFGKLIKRKNNGYLEENKKFNIYDVLGTITGAVGGGIVLGLFGHPFVGLIAGALVGYFATPHFVPKFFRWVKKITGKDRF